MFSLHLFELIFISIFFLIDTFIFLKYKTFTFKGALLNFAFWLVVALSFFAILFMGFGEVKAGEFLTGYILERILSIDNIFVFYIIFQFFKLDRNIAQKILFLGIILAMLLRVIFILIGAKLVSQFYFVMYFFGAFLIFTGLKLLFVKDDEENQDFSNNIIVKICKKFLPIDEKSTSKNFTIIKNGKLFFTPIFLVMILVGFTDVLFALDSIPAIFGITLDSSIIIMANFLSLMGLRAIFFLISNVIEKFHYIKYALSLILTFIGVKILLANFVHIPVVYSLSFVVISVIIAILLSIIFPQKCKKS